MILNKCVARVIASRTYWKRVINNTNQTVAHHKSFIHSRASQSYYSSFEDEAIDATTSSSPDASEAILNNTSSQTLEVVNTSTDKSTIISAVTDITSDEVSASAAEVLVQENAFIESVQIAKEEVASTSSDVLAHSSIPEVVSPIPSPDIAVSSFVQEVDTSNPVSEIVASRSIPEGVNSSSIPEKISSCSTSEVETSSSVSDVLTSTVDTTPTTVAQAKVQLIDALSSVTDPSFLELGLATGHYPHHYLQSLLEIVNTSTDLPWFATIAIGTFIFRLVTLPVFIKQRKYQVLQSNHMPEQMELMKKITAAKAKDDPMKVQKARENYFAFEERSGTSQLKTLRNNAAMPLMFGFWIYSLRQMVAVPVPSLDATSMGWIDSLCEADPYLVLPILSGATVGLQVYLSLNATGALANSKNLVLQRYGKYIPALPVVALPFFFGNSASAILIYIATNSAFTLLTSVAMNNERVKSYLQMPERVTVDKEGRTPKSFGDMWTEMREGSERKYGLKREAREIKRQIKAIAKARKKELKGDPPVTYKIGTQAKLRSAYVADFENDDWKPKRNYVFQR